MAERFVIEDPLFPDGSNTVEFMFQHSRLGRFAERVEFPASDRDAGQDEIQTLARLAALAIGTSYFKARPTPIVETQFALTPRQHTLAHDIYTNGLGEFYVRNGLQFPPDLAIEAPVGKTLPAARQEHPSTSSIVAFGGGKDSHVARAVIEQSGGDARLASVCLSPRVADRLVKMSGKDIEFIWRTLDPKLIELNASGSVLNGHIPITAINSALLCLHAHRQGIGSLVFANERSASVATMSLPNGAKVNHQHSKSVSFERLFRDALDEAVGAGVTYYSVLRPCGELWTIKALVEHAEPALNTFASCNRNFVFAGPQKLRPDQNWCNHCSKCVYTAILLATVCSIDLLERIMEGNPFREMENAHHVRELTGILDVKPWECVGDVDEIVTALSFIYSRPGWADLPLLQAMKPELVSRWPDFAAMRHQMPGYFSLDHEHFIPADVMQTMRDWKISAPA